MIRLRTLGALDLTDAAGTELRSVLAQPKRATLVAYLAIASRRGPLRRDSIVGLFWPELDEERSRAALNQAVHFLRRALGPDAIVSRNASELDVDRASLWCDATAFEDALEVGCLADALELYRGDLLDGLHLAGSVEFERWLDAERFRLAALWARAIETLAERGEAAGDYPGAAALWRRLAARDPLSSRVALRLIRALAAAGDPGAALQHVRVHETLLRSDLDVALSPDIGAFVAELQSGRASPVASHVLRSPALEPTELAPREELSAPATPPRTDPGDPARLTTVHAPGRWHRVLSVAGAAVVLLAAVVGLLSANREPVIRSIAVLPPTVDAGDSAEAALADGLHDQLVLELGRYHELAVTSRTSVLQYKGTTKPSPVIARELDGVDGLVESAVHLVGHRVRISATLLHGASDRRLWGNSYERDLRDVLLLQQEVAAEIARAIRINVEPHARARRVEGPADSLPREFHLRELYNQGRTHEANRSLIGIRTAIAKYRQAIDRDPDFAVGYAGLAEAYGLLAAYWYAPMRATLDTAREMAERAVALNGDDSETRTALGLALGNDGEFHAAEREFLRAIELNGSDARARYWYAHLLVALGRAAEARDQIERVAELDPYAPRGVTAMRLYTRYMITGQRPHLAQPAAAVWGPVVKAEPGEPWARRSYALLLAEEGKCTDAFAELRTAELQAPNNISMDAAEALIDLRCGREPRARAAVQALKRRDDARAQGLWIAIMHAQLGEPDSAFAWLAGVEWTIAARTDLRAHRLLDPLRADARFVRLIKRVSEPVTSTTAVSR